MDSKDLDKISDTITGTLKDTCDRLKIIRYLPGEAEVNEPVIIIDACKGDHSFTLKYSIADLLQWQEQNVLSEILFRDRYKALK